MNNYRISVSILFFVFNIAHAQVSETVLVKPIPVDETVWKQGIAIPNLYIAGDSEGFSTAKAGGSILPWLEHGDRYSGMTYQYSHFFQNGWSAEGNQFGLITKDINPRTALGYNANLNVNTLKGYQLLTTDSQYSVRLGETTKAEFIINRDRVETQNSINNGIYYTLGAASIEQQLHERVTVIAMGGNMYFSDTNTRPFIRAKAIYSLMPEHGITAQIRYRQYTDTKTDVPNNYFNPSNYVEMMIALAIRKRVHGWMLSGTAGLGRQSVNMGPSTETQLFEVSATSPFVGSVFFRTRAGYGKSAGFQGPDYTYSYLMQELIFSF